MEKKRQGGQQGDVHDFMFFLQCPQSGRFSQAFGEMPGPWPACSGRHWRCLLWGLKLLGNKSATQVRGSDLLLYLCREAEKQKIPIGLYGGTGEEKENYVKKIQASGCQISLWRLAALNRIMGQKAFMVFACSLSCTPLYPGGYRLQGRKL